MYTDTLTVLQVSVGLAQACPNKTTSTVNELGVSDNSRSKWSGKTNRTQLLGR